MRKSLINNRIKYINNRSRHNIEELYATIDNVIIEDKLSPDTDEVFESAFGSEIDSFEDLTLFSVLKYLDEKDITIIKLHVIYGYTFERIAAILGMKMGSVSNRYSRAINRIRERMDDSK